jgi:nucleoside-diphosphate-sugar epimerase
MQEKILVIGASGQIGTELVMELRKIYGSSAVIATDIRAGSKEVMESGPFELSDVLDVQKLHELVKQHGVTQIYLLAALLSAAAEQKPKLAWRLNVESLLSVLEMAKEKLIRQIYWPSSIAVFGPTTPKDQTPQCTIMEPNTVYGISKQTGERWCEYYHHKHGVDVRSLRYPGLIGWKAEPTGGTTDYAVHIYHEALKKGHYECFLSENTTLPMMYMEDALNATIQLMQAPTEKIKIRSSYNIAGMSFSPKQIASEIRKKIPSFTIAYKPDFRQKIADSWPHSIDDSEARRDWGWKPSYNLAKMSEQMLDHLKLRY